MEKERKFKFALVGHQIQLANAVRSCINPETEEVMIKVVNMGEAVPIAKQLFEEGIEVVFAHMGTAPLIFEATGKPVVNIPRTRIDLLVAFRRAKKFGSKIALSSFAEPTDGIDIIEDLLNINVHQIVFNSVMELEQGVYAAWDEGIKVMVGGGISTKIMNDLGGKGIVSYPRKSVVEEAFKEARAIAKARRKELADSARLRTILQMIDEGIIGVDNYGRINIYNDSAQKILGLELKSLLGQSLPKIVKDMNLIDVLSRGEPDIENIKKIGKANVILNTLPINIDGKAKGAVALIKDASKIQNISRKLKENLYIKGFVTKHTIEDIKGHTSAMKLLLDKSQKYAETDANILIRGETGTGKELLAQSIHNLSIRSAEPFIAINCAALPETLLESELFGYEEGAFTGAKRGGKIGLFELANSGTIFLDEIADISPSLQVRLLRVIETKEVMRVGGDRYVPVDVRIISSTYKNLSQEVGSGKFRADLFFRLAVLNLNIPPLRDRIEDVPYIIEDLLSKYGKEPNVITIKMKKAMESYFWPGNIRELRSFVESYLILLGKSSCDSQLFFSLLEEKIGDEKDHISSLPEVEENVCEPESDPLTPIANPIGDKSLKEILEEYEISVIKKILKECRFSKKETAKRLGISVNTLWRKLNSRNFETLKPVE